MKDISRQLSILSTPGFIVGLLVLLLNDWFLKDLFHNWFTGKLSDFAGMFVFPLFWVAFFPKYAKHIFWCSALWFVYWKSPYSQPLIDGWNILGLYSISRVVDLSDLMALAMVPLAYRYWKLRPSIISFKLHPVVPLGVAAFAFIATSHNRTFPINKEYYLPFSKKNIQSNFSNLRGVSPQHYTSYFDDTVNIEIRPSQHSSLYPTHYTLTLLIDSINESKTRIKFVKGNVRNKGGDSIAVWMTADIEKLIINPLLLNDFSTHDTIPISRMPNIAP